MTGQEVFEKLAKMSEEERRNVTVPEMFTVSDAKDIIDEITSNGLLWIGASEQIYDALGTIPDETLAGMFARATEKIRDEDYEYEDGVRDKVRYAISDYAKEHFGEDMADENDGELRAAAQRYGVVNLDNKVIKDIEASDVCGAEYGNPHTYSLRELYSKYETDRAETEYEFGFPAWLDDITHKNGTCEWLGNMSNLFRIDGVGGYSLAEAESIAYERKGEDIEILDENLDEWALCVWCEDLYPKSGLRKEKDMGLLCEYCIEAIRSRGEKLVIEDD